MRKLICILAVVWACGMVAFAADFIDQDDIKNQEAVTMLTDLGVFCGYEDGSFRPFNTITRAEISTVITYLSTEEVYETETVSFSDTRYSWASNYIEYCAKNGIINGSDGKFRPEDNVTGYELVKMILVLLGHDNGNFMGPAWKENVENQGTTEEILFGYKGNLNQYVTRDEAAYLLNNAIQCHMVESYGEDGTIHYVLDMMRNPLALLEIRFGAKLVNGVMLANNQYDLRAEPENLGENMIYIEGYAKPFKVSEDIANNNPLLGHKITVYAITGMDYNRIVGTVKTYSQEISIPVYSYETLDTIFSSSVLSLAENVIYLVDYQVVSKEEARSYGDQLESLKILDHEGDNIYDFVLIQLKKEILPES